MRKYSPQIKNIAERRRYLLFLEKKTDKALKILVKALKNDSSQVIRHEACFLLANTKRKDAISPLIHAIKNDKSLLVKHEALGDLGIQTKEVIDLLTRYAKNKNAMIRETATVALATLQK